MLKWFVLFCLIAVSCNDVEKAKLFDKITAETCECSKGQNMGAAAAILTCMMQSAEKHDADLKRVGVDQNTEAGLKQLQYEVSVRLASRCREVYMKALEESRTK